MTLQERLSRLNQRLMENDPSRRLLSSSYARTLYPPDYGSVLQASDLSPSHRGLDDSGAFGAMDAACEDDLMREATEALSYREMVNLQLRRELEEAQEALSRLSREDGARVDALRQRLDAYQIYLRELDGEKQQEQLDYERQITQLNQEIATMKLELVETQRGVVEDEVVQFVRGLKDRLI